MHVSVDLNLETGHISPAWIPVWPELKCALCTMVSCARPGQVVSQELITSQCQCEHLQLLDRKSTVHTAFFQCQIDLKCCHQLAKSVDLVLGSWQQIVDFEVSTAQLEL